jgi:alanyl-tRNA synthetase
MVCGITEDMQESLSANDVIQVISKTSNGKGGGRKDFAQGAGVTDNFEEFVNSIPDIVQSIA